MKGHETSDIKNMSFNAFLFSNIRSFLLVSCTKLIALANEIITELLYLVSRHLWHYVFRVEDTNQDGLISRDEFTEGYMKMHCTKTGKRRWSRGIGIWQTRALNMDKIIEGSNNKK